MSGAAFDHFLALSWGEHGAFTGVTGNRHRYVVKKLGCTGQHVDVTVGDGIKRAGIYTVTHEVKWT